MKTENSTQPSQEEIAAYAYHLWEANGRQSGRDAEYWFQAQTQIKARTNDGGSAERRDGHGAATENKPQNSPPKKRKTENTPVGQRQPAFA
jgi:hypothetical protein